MVAEINRRLDASWSEWKEKYPESANLKIAIMGCVVNGPGEAGTADIGISLPGKSETYAMVFEKGKAMKELKGEGIVEEFWEMVKERVRCLA
jgi:(E)-4-hydroxy-3-methylbut-2-enyl-diphosphate synthase